MVSTFFWYVLLTVAYIFVGVVCFYLYSFAYEFDGKTTINSLAGWEVSSISVRDVRAIINCRKPQNKARSLRK